MLKIKNKYKFTWLFTEFGTLTDDIFISGCCCCGTPGFDSIRLLLLDDSRRLSWGFIGLCEDDVEADIDVDDDGGRTFELLLWWWFFWLLLLLLLCEVCWPFASICELDDDPDGRSVLGLAFILEDDWCGLWFIWDEDDDDGGNERWIWSPEKKMIKN